MTEDGAPEDAPQTSSNVLPVGEYEDWNNHKMQETKYVLIMDS